MKNRENKRITLKSLQHLYFRSQLILILSLAVFLGVAVIVVVITVIREIKNRKKASA